MSEETKCNDTLTPIKPGYQCDSKPDHDGNHKEVIEQGAIKLTLEWSD